MVRYGPAILAIGAILGSQWPATRAVAWQTPETKNAEKVEGTAQPDAKTAAAQDGATEPQQTASWVSARATLRTFILAMETKDYRTAITALDFSAVEPPPDPFQQITYAQRLKASMDRLSLIDSEQMSNDPKSDPVPFPPDKADSGIVISRGEDGRWRFAADTVREINAIYDVLKDSPPLDLKATTAVEPPPDEATAEATPDPPSDSDGGPNATEASAPVIPHGLRSARRTMHSLFESLENKDYALAVATLDLSRLEAEDPDMGPYAKLNTARRLKEVIERMAQIDYAEISDDPKGPAVRFPPDVLTQPIEISRDEAGLWRFSAETVVRIESLYKIYIDKPILNVAEQEKPWYDRQLVMGNETWRLLALFAAIFAGLLIGQSVRMALNWRANTLERRGHMLRAVVIKTLAAAAVGVFFLIGLSCGMGAMILEHEVETLASVVIRVIFALVVGYISFRLVDVAVEMLREMATRTGSTLNNMLVPIVSTSLRLTIGVLVVLDIATVVSDQPPSTVLAGLGAGGLAVGLAAQDTIKNLFGSIMIFADRPFELGDRIAIDGHDGPVEQVGFRSTRIRTLDGHLVTIPNGELANKTIHNIGKRLYIRRVMNIRVTSDTPPQKVQQALTILRELLVDHEGLQEDRPPRVFLEDFLDTAINVRAIYWFHPPSYWDYCEFNERINLQIVERFHAEGIRFALPSQRLLVAGDPEQPLGT